MVWKTGTAVSALIAMSAFAPAASAAVIVLADNFDSDALKLNWSGDAVFASLAVPTGKHVSSTDLIGKGGSFDFYPGHGRYVDLDGSTSIGNSPSGVLQSVKSFKAGKYMLTFDLAGNARGAPGQTTTVDLGGTSVASLTLPSAAPYTLYSYTFTSTGGKLSFTESGPSTFKGAILDNVTLTSLVPEPATWALMLVGVGGLGAALRSSRRTMAAA